MTAVIWCVFFLLKARSHSAR